MLSAIIVAAGSSQRMGFDKVFAMLAGKPVVAHAIAAFEAAACVNEIILIGRAERLAEFDGVVVRHRFSKVRQIAAGGAARQDSVRAGLELTGAASEMVAVHDAARPLITATEIEAVFAAAKTHGAAALASPLTDTLKRGDAGGFVCDSIEREGVYAMQTPQIFLRELLRAAYAEVARRDLTVTDEVSALQLLGQKVMLVPNREANPKITFPGDLRMAELVLTQRRST